MTQHGKTQDAPSVRIRLEPCPKAYRLDQDKAVNPAQTLRRVRERLDALPLSILARTRRIDNGRLGIPVYLSICGSDAKKCMPTRKQMGKGASAEQAEASALMELMERYGFFTFWERLPGAVRATWSEAEARFGDSLMPLDEVMRACHDSLRHEDARRIMDLRSWIFLPALRVADQRVRWVPLDLFKQLGEFNGSSAGNTDAESLLQGVCELVERHVCCLADRERLPLPTITAGPGAVDDPVLEELLEKFHRQGVTVVLKDFSLGMPVPTVAALAWDPSTLGESSEIVFTAGTATSPAKAAVRALSEVAQLAGDFNSRACYEASGLPKFSRLEDTEHLRPGPLALLRSLPSCEADDILDELLHVAKALQEKGFSLYAVSTTNPDTAVPSHYSFVPGFQFRERDANASLGLFVGRLVSEEAEGDIANIALETLEEIYPNGHFVPFFRGMLALREGALEAARFFFSQAGEMQPDDDSRALTAFYFGYTHTLEDKWEKALPSLDTAARLCPDMKEYLNLRGVCLFRLGRYAEAARDFQDILARLDKGSVMDILNLGLCHKRLGNAEPACHYLKTALELDPDLEQARRELDELRLSMRESTKRQG